MYELDDVLALLVLLTRLERLLVLPAECVSARLAVDVCYGVQSREQIALFGGPGAHVDHLVEEIGAALAALERLRDEVVVAGEVSATMHTHVYAVLFGQKDLECFADHSLRICWLLLLLGGEKSVFYSVDKGVICRPTHQFTSNKKRDKENRQNKKQMLIL